MFRFARVLGLGVGREACTTSLLSSWAPSSGDAYGYRLVVVSLMLKKYMMVEGELVSASRCLVSVSDTCGKVILPVALYVFAEYGEPV